MATNGSFSPSSPSKMVSEAEAAASTFDLNPGQTRVSSTLMMTKSAAQTRYNLNAASLSGYASNQLIPQSVWASGVVSYGYTVSTFNSFALVSDACLYSNDMGYLYSSSSTLTDGMVFYTNSSLTTLFVGSNNYYQLWVDVGANRTGKISSSGVLSLLAICSADTTPPTAPTIFNVTRSGTTANISWSGATDNVGITSYELHRSVGGSGNYLLRFITPNSPLTDSNLTSGEIYYYKVRAKDAAGNFSSFSVARTITIV